ncbi:hypothetical protein EW146_g8379 [Bondarzewia mesenterica]|uniref:U6 snRNA phosphodiesterase 1 n=1 Tax=Bondarzewia mesenterica TaxID=1095465 RepID=A0A4V3XDN4_9AGAM|nr:hypothetical protein EW146_g8379 [Bondarzewia mesenterica]
MKRSFTPLVAYAGSDDDEDKDTPHPPSPPEKKKRKLPPLASQLTVPIPVDDPSRHQGRSRSTPHVEGQWAAYVYVPVSVGGRERRGLRRLVRRVVDRARERVPSLRVVETGASVERKEEEASEELHISLSRPIFIRSHQREDVKRAVKAIAKAHPPIAPRAVKTRTRFTASFAALAELINDERTRTFLCMEVGAGHDQLRALSDALSPLLRSLRQKPYYEHPRFHGSLAWALLDPSTPQAQASHDAKVASPSPPSPSLAVDTDTPSSEWPPESSSQSKSPSLAAPGPPFPTIPGFPPDLVASLNAEFGNEIASGVGVFEVEEIQVRIGKEVFGWNIGV